MSTYTVTAYVTIRNARGGVDRIERVQVLTDGDSKRTFNTLAEAESERSFGLGEGAEEIGIDPDDLTIDITED